MKYIYFKDGHTHIRRESDMVKPEGEEVCRYLFHPSQAPSEFNPDVDPPDHIECCSFNLVTGIDLNNPDAVLEAMVKSAKTNVSPSRGGFRHLGLYELAAWYLSNIKITEPEAITEDVRGATFFHPSVRSGLLFTFGNVVPSSAVAVLGHIYDIRRFASTDNSNSSSKLRSYFRLYSPQPMAELLKRNEEKDPSLKDDRLFSLVTAWSSHPYVGLGSAKASQDPQAWLYRDMFDLMKLAKSTSIEEMALIYWKISKRFLNYLSLCWLDALDDVEFLPEKFFNRKDEVEDYYAYREEQDLAEEVFEKLSFDSLFGPE